MIILKYKLEVTDHQILNLPYGSKPLSVGFQNGELMLWAMVDSNEILQEVPVCVVGTGREVKYLEDYHYVGTVKDQGPFWWHVFIGDTD